MILTHGANSLSVGGEPPIPPDVTLYDNLIRNTYSSYTNESIPVTIDLVNTDKYIALDFTTAGMVYENATTFFTQGLSGLFEMRLAYAYTNAAYFGYRNGKASAQYSNFSNLTRINNHQIVGMRNHNLYDMTNGTVIITGSKYVANTIGTIYFGPSMMSAGSTKIHRFYIQDDNDTIFIDLRPAKKGEVIGLYDMMTAQFYPASNSSQWSVSNNS